MKKFYRNIKTSISILAVIAIQVFCGNLFSQHLKSGFPIDEIVFTKVAEGDIVNDGGWNYGMVWADFNMDDYPDLFVANNDGDNGKNNFLYLNNGDGTFEKVVSGEVVTDGGASYAASAVDVDRDFIMDLFVANHNENNFLYIGNGDGTFTKITQGNVVTDGGKSVGCAWADYNVDGYPDLYVVNRDQKNFLYLGSGNPNSLYKITEGSIVNDIANSSGCAWADYNNDGYPDLYVANSGSPSCLYKGDGYSFTKIEEEPFISDVSACSGASWGDADNDGDLDLFVSTGQLGMYPNWFYINNGDGTFTKITDSPLVNEATWCSGSAWGDYDKDGDQDLAVGSYDGDNLLFENDGFGNFVKTENNEFVNDGGYTEGLAWADFDDDGDLDIFTAKNNYFGGNNSFFVNNGNNNNWLKIHLRGFGSCILSYGPIGAKIFVYANINNEPVMQMRELNTQSGGGQGGQNEAIQFFGLGDAVIVDSVVIVWNFETWKIENASVNTTIVMDLITQTQEYPLFAKQNFTAYPNPATESITFSIVSSNQKPANILVTDIYGRLIFEFSVNSNKFIWDLKDRFGKPVIPGVYMCKYIVGNQQQSIKIVVQR